MKRYLKACLKTMWGWTEPIRHPILMKLENFFGRCLSNHDRHGNDESMALMDQVVRELFRLQRQVEILQDMVEAQSQSLPAPSIAGAIDAPVEHLKAG
ncbi:hypothetical protein ACYOEI_09430 [Singulisphaera rosea]